MKQGFQFESFADFMTMSGHGPYVWACYAIGFVCLAWLGISPLVKRKRFIEQQRRNARIEANRTKQATQVAS